MHQRNMLTPPSSTLLHLLVAVGLLTALGGLAGCDDGDDDSGSEEISAPTISDISAEGSPILPGGQVTVSVEAEGDALEYDWDLPKDWSDSGSDSGTESVTLTAPDDQATEATVSVTVENDGGSTSSEVTVATRGPAIESFDVDPLPGKEGDTATFTTDAYNRDGRELTYDYRVGGTRLLEDRGSEWDWTVPELAMGGRYLLEGIVTDSDNLTATAGVETTIKGASAWPAFGGDRQRSGLSPSPDAEGAEGKEKWAFDTGGSVSSSPAIGADGTVYVGSDDSKVYALDPDDGTEQWAYDTGDWIKSSPIIGVDDTVYVGSNNGNVYALDPNTDDKEWAYETGGKVSSSPAIGADGTVYVSSWDDKVYALDADNGDEKWAFDTGDYVDSSPAIGADGTVYVGSWDDKVYALDPADGSEKWSFETGGEVSSSPAIGADGTVYVGSNDYHVYALDPDAETKGERKKWAFETGYPVKSSPAISADGTIYVSSMDHKVYALDPDDGTRKWAFDTGDKVSSSPTIGADGTIYVGSWDDKVYALNPDDGSQKWAFETGNNIRSAPAIGADGTIYIGSYDNKVYAIE